MNRFALLLFLFALPAGAEPITGSLDVHWNEGAADCAAARQPPLQVHTYEPQTFILRQNPCLSFEANFLYLLIGTDKALLIDTGAVSDPQQMPLAKTVMDLLPGEGASKLPLLVVHTHSHLDHRDGDGQFTSLSSVEIVPPDLTAIQAFFGFTQWPEGVAHLELGGRTVDVVPAPGHHDTHVVFYDDRTGLAFTGDFLLPGRLLIKDLDADRASAQRVIDFLKPRPVTHILGAHIELDATGEAYPAGSNHHPNERSLAMTLADLLAVPAALDHFNGFYSRQGGFIVANPLRNLMVLATAALVVLGVILWMVSRLLRNRRRAAAATASAASSR